ncbi:molybdopterin-dependent oxidoreductase [Pelagibacterium flavum]|uniref:Molybdopterin-dependent oxidoreductase n=1 Tax=Pelagibacterium flavum TaxID=2984530 RepID=A0ABY6IRL7_9HYPH|nr:molybdopterin-dependent oxidoreductase [Pelagibacterium sp. YIM 151497]UYQ73249.1 molybdopterin-dependent oxidoreductase [Pelagibacterium sp. YIM 151497]
MKRFSMQRRKFLTASAAGVAGVTLAGCDQFDSLLRPGHPVRDTLASANDLTLAAQRLFLGDEALAKEFAESEIRQGMRPNGTTDPQKADYVALRNNDFADYQLVVDGLVETPQSYSLNQLRNMPSRTQITRHDCVEGWSCIAKWTGVPLTLILDEVRPTANARYCVFHCYDNYGGGLSASPYYESVDLIDARHPQTILAYGMNDAALPVRNGAPVRVRIERQLGYKMAKYLRRIELVDDFSQLHRGKGSYWADHGYDWYAGI